MTNLFNFKHRHAFNFNTVWQIDSLVPAWTILFDWICSRFIRNVIKTKSNTNEIESFAKIKQIGESDNWQIYDMITPSSKDVNFEKTLLNLMNFASRSGANSMSLLSGSIKLSDKLKSSGFLKIQKSFLCKFQVKDIKHIHFTDELNIRKKLPRDQHNIFKLYTSNKSKSNIVHTLNFEHWDSLIAKFDNRFNEFVIEENGILTCWFRIKFNPEVVKVEILAYSNLNRRIIDAVWQTISSFEARFIYFLISTEDASEEKFLSEYGMQVISKYELYVKWLTKFVDNRKKINSRVVNTG